MTTSFILIIIGIYMVAFLTAQRIEVSPAELADNSTHFMVLDSDKRLHNIIETSIPAIERATGKSDHEMKSPIELDQHLSNGRPSLAATAHHRSHTTAWSSTSTPPPFVPIPKLLAQRQDDTTMNNGTVPYCGGYYRTPVGVIQTPNFPRIFDTPIECTWIVDASEIHADARLGVNISIIVYLTQLYVLGGLKFTEYMYYSDDYKVPSHRVFQLTEDDVTKVAWIQFTSQYLEIRFQMRTLDGTHLRALDRLLDVYGFNITYEVDTAVKPNQCNALQCRFLGHCYAKGDFSGYQCSCFPGFSGSDCGYGPLCEDSRTNFCQNGGTCKHMGDAAITCHCPPGFKGNKCEISEVNEITMGCTGNSSEDCQQQCEFPSTFGYRPRYIITSSQVAARTKKTRYEVTIRLGTNLTILYRTPEGENRATDFLPAILERHVSIVLGMIYQLYTFINPYGEHTIHFKKIKKSIVFEVQINHAVFNKTLVNRGVIC